MYPLRQLRHWANSLIVILTALAAVAAAIVIPAQHAFALGAPFSCSASFYQVISGQLKLLDPNTGTYTNIGSPYAHTYNAIGYNTSDNFIYGLDNDVGSTQANLLKIASDGTVDDLLLPSGLTRGNIFTGAMDSSNNLIVRKNSPREWYSINVSSNIATTLTIDTSLASELGSDMVIVPDAGQDIAYLLNNQTLYRVNLATLANLTSHTVTGPDFPTTGTHGFGAAWADSSGDIFFSDNSDGHIYRIDGKTSTTPTATLVTTGTITFSNDGANCPLASNPFVPPVATDDSGSGPMDAPITGDVIPNDTGTSITVTSNTNPTHGTVTVAADGSYTYTPNTGFSGTDSFDYTITDSLAQTDTATVTLTITPSDTTTTTQAVAASTIATTGTEIKHVAGFGAMMGFGGFGLLGLAVLRRQRLTK